MNRLFWVSIWSIAASVCDHMIDISERRTTILTLSNSNLAVCFENHIPDVSYEFRLYAPGYSKFSYSPEKYRIDGSTKTLTITRQPKTTRAAVDEADDFVVTVDPLVAGLIPSALMPVIVICIFLAGLSFYCASSAMKFFIKLRALKQSTLVPPLLDCLPELKRYTGAPNPAPAGMSQWRTVYPQYSPREEDIAIPSTLGPSTRQSDLPTIPPPLEFWRLKKLDASANVMDYWVKSEKSWDIEGIESDIQLSKRK